MDYLTLKWLHVMSSTVLFGTGIGSAFFVFVASVRRDRAALAAATRTVVLADWLFTAPAVVMQPLTGYWLAALAGFSPGRGWLLTAAVLYAIAIACWLPVVALQLRMRTVMATDSLGIPPAYWPLFRWWTVLGTIAFGCFIALFRLMVLKRL